MFRRCDIVIATWNSVAMTRDALASVRDQSGFPFRLILVDNSDQEDARASYREIAASSEYGEIVLIQNEGNIGWLKATNIGIQRADSEYVCLLNNDVICGSNWLKKCVELIERESNVALINPRGNERSENDNVTDINAYAQHLQKARSQQFTEMDRCSGYCMFARRQLFDQLGLLDEIFDGGYFEDFDFSRRVQATGSLCVQCDDAFVYHLGSQSFKQVPEGPKRAMHDRNRDLCYSRWGRVPRLFVRVCNPAPNVDELRTLIRKNRVYLLDNKNIPKEILEFRHGNLEIQQNSWLWEPLYFWLRAVHWARKQKIDEARILYR